MTARRSLLLAGGIFFGLAFLGSLFIAFTTARGEAALYGVFPLALSVVMFAMARKEPHP